MGRCGTSLQGVRSFAKVPSIQGGSTQSGVAKHGLKRVHESGYVYCNVKTESNRIITFFSRTETEYRAKIVDFGLGKMVK